MSTVIHTKAAASDIFLSLSRTLQGWSTKCKLRGQELSVRMDYHRNLLSFKVCVAPGLVEFQRCSGCVVSWCHLCNILRHSLREFDLSPLPDLHCVPFPTWDGVVVTKATIEPLLSMCDGPLWKMRREGLRGLACAAAASESNARVIEEHVAHLVSLCELAAKEDWQLRYWLDLLVSCTSKRNSFDPLN